MNEDYSELLAQRIGKRLKMARERRGFTAADMAEQAEIPLADYERYEQGKECIEVDDLERITAILRLPIGHFLEDCVLCGSSR